MPMDRQDIKKRTGPNQVARRQRLSAEGAPKVRTAPSAKKLYPDDAYYMRGDAPKKKRRPIKKRTSFGKVAMVTGGSILAALLVAFLIQTFLFQIIVVSGDSMFKVLTGGEWVVVTKYDYWSKETPPERGDIIAVKQGGGVVIRRIVALPEETFRIDQNGDTLIGSDPIGEPYVSLKSYEEYPESVLPKGFYFVMNDNRTDKSDSRSPEFGLVSRQKIAGKVRAILFPFGQAGVVQ